MSPGDDGMPEEVRQRGGTGTGSVGKEEQGSGKDKVEKKHGSLWQLPACYTEAVLPFSFVVKRVVLTLGELRKGQTLQFSKGLDPSNTLLVSDKSYLNLHY